MTGGEALYHDVGAVFKFDNVGIPGAGGNGVRLYVIAFGTDGQVAEVLNGQLNAVKHFLPAVVGAVFGFVAGGGAQVVKFGIQNDFCIRCQRIEKFIHGGYMNLGLIPGGHRYIFYRFSGSGFFCPGSRQDAKQQRQSKGENEGYRNQFFHWNRSFFIIGLTR